jgi:pre-mRNA-splicing factor ATP-dependent RNA helicase DHX15/PRP43
MSNDIFENKGILDPEGINLNPLNNLPYSDTYKNLAKFWSNLPTYKFANDVIKSIKNNDVLLISSGTGSGKSVLVSKYCLHANNYQGKIIMTLPKKLITKASAEFAAKTLDIKLGEQVGYQFRGDNLKSNKTILLYSTDGSIIAQIKSDPLLRQIDIIIIDEAHERKVQIDLLLYLLKNAIKLRKEKNMKPLKLVIMSATINQNIFAEYYKDFSYEYLFLSGTPNYPIETFYLKSSLNQNEYIEEGKKNIFNIVKKINDNKLPEGDILFFVCTISECEEVTLELGNKLNDCFTIALFSGFDKELEQYINSPDKFKELNNNYKRRVFISTNVAESSLTIDGIVYVIDSGLELSVKYDPQKKINIMTKNFITKAQMSQRKGRAGRTKEGYCYKLYTEKNEENTIDFPLPEIKKVDLKNICLSLLKMGLVINKGNFNVENTIEMFTKFIEPPGEKYILDGFDFSIKNKLIGKDMTLSDIGKLIVDSRLDLTDGLTLIYAWNISTIVFKKVFKIISICSFLKSGINDFFYEDIDKNKKNNILKELKNNSSNSEHILLLQLYKYIEDNQNIGIFNIQLFKKIEQIYSNQIDKLEKLYNKYDIKIDVNKKDLDKNIIQAFNFGYKEFRAYRVGNEFKYNGLKCNLDKAEFKFTNFSSIIFYSNINVNNKFNISICSPYILE